MPEQAWRCTTCGCLWRLNKPTAVQPGGSISLYNEAQSCKPCCDNVTGVLEEVVIVATGKVTPPDEMVLWGES